MQKEDEEFEEAWSRLRNEAIELYANTVTEVSNSYPRTDPAQITDVWNKVWERLYTKLSNILGDKVDYGVRIEILRIVFTMEIGALVSGGLIGRAEAWKHLHQAMEDDLSNDETVYRLIWCLTPDAGHDLDSEKVTDIEAKYIRLLGRAGELGVRSIARIMGRSTETIHRVLKQQQE